MRFYPINTPNSDYTAIAVVPGVAVLDRHWLTGMGIQKPDTGCPLPKAWRDNNAITYANYNPQYFDGYDGVYKTGYIVPEMSNGAFVTTPWVNEYFDIDVAKLYHPNQIRFYREHRDDFARGIPSLTVITYDRNYAVGFNPASGVLDPPPLAMRPDMAFRLNPATGDFEAFFILQYGK